MRRNVNKLATLVMTGMLAASMSFGAFADNEGATGVTGATGTAEQTAQAEQTVYEDSVQFKKILTKSDSTAPTPTATITFTAKAGAAVAATANTPEIKAGVGTLTFTSAVYDTNAALTQTITGTFGNTLPFTEPGIYRYTVTEASNNTAITNDTNASKTLDVYVERNSQNNLEVKYSVLSNGTAAPTKNGTAASYSAKTTGFKNTYTTYDLTLEKKVDGAMGEKTRDFDFTIVLTGGPKKATITAKQNNDGTAKDVEVSFNEEGVANITGIKLDDEDTFVITGLPDTTAYTITENLDAKEGYTVSTSGSAESPQLTDATTNLTVSGRLSDKPATGTEKVTFTNTRTAITPTGVAMDVAPYALMVALAGGAAFTFLRKKESFED